MSIFEEDLRKDAEKVKLPSCLSFFNEWRNCSSSQNQFRHYYIYGKLLDCKSFQDNWTNCLSWKLKKNKEARDSILRHVNVTEEEKKKNHTAGIWNFRQDPAKDWKDEMQ